MRLSCNQLTCQYFQLPNVIIILKQYCATEPRKPYEISEDTSIDYAKGIKICPCLIPSVRKLQR